MTDVELIRLVSSSNKKYDEIANRHEVMVALLRYIVGHGPHGDECEELARKALDGTLDLKELERRGPES